MNPFLELEQFPEVIIMALAKAGLDDELAAGMSMGGIRACSRGDLFAHDFASVLGMSAIKNTSVYADLEARPDRAGNDEWFICDTYYGQVYPAKWTQAAGLYGAVGIDPGTPQVDLPQARPLRVRHRTLPAYIASTRRDLQEIAAACIPIAGDERQVLYRGQTRQYVLQRTDVVRNMLYGNAVEVVEPSLLSSAQRAGLDGDQIIGLLNLELQSLVYRDLALPDVAERASRIMISRAAVPAAVASSPPVVDSYRGRAQTGGLAREVLSLAQHYGLPSFGIDLTQDLDVALWFALTRAVSDGTRQFTYRPHHWSDDEGPASWPCVYFFTTGRIDHALFSLERLLRIRAARPERQQALTAYGAWGWHANHIAEWLVAVAYLAPGFSRTPFRGRTLFPSRAEDGFYNWLLRRRDEVLADSTHPYALLYDRVPEFDVANSA